MAIDSTRRFSDRVERYVKYRPTYAHELLRVLERAIGFTSADIVADIGSGTGISTALLLSHGNRVFGVEPNAEMRRAAEAALGGNARFQSVDGTAAATTLGDASVDVVTSMQAFHWFEPAAARREFARILKPGGWVALVWNERQTSGDPFLEAYERLLLEFATDYARVRQAQPSSEAFGAFFSGGGYERDVVGNEQTFDFEGLAGRLLSSSYAPAEGQPGHERMMTELGRIFEAHQVKGKVRFVYETRVYCGRVEGG